MLCLLYLFKYFVTVNNKKNRYLFSAGIEKIPNMGGCPMIKGRGRFELCGVVEGMMLMIKIVGVEC